MLYISSVAVLALASSAIAAPTMSKRGGGEGGYGGSGPQPSGGNQCTTGSNVCNNGNDVWFAKKTTSDCETGSTYCCSSSGKDNQLNCLNALNGNNVAVDLGSLLGLRKRNEPEQGGPGGPPPSGGNQCTTGSNFCNNGNQAWIAKKTESDCETGNTYCCSSSGKGNEFNCINALNANDVSVDLSDLLGSVGLSKRTGGGEQWGEQGGPQGGPPPANQCSTGSNFCNNGNEVWFAKKTDSDCTTGDTYCCDSSGGDVNALNCASLLNGNTVNVNISDIIGGSRVAKRTDGGQQWGEQGAPQGGPPPANQCSTGSNFCNNGNNAWTAKNTESDCTTGDTYCCDSSGGELNALNCANVLNGNTVSVSLGDLL